MNPEQELYKEHEKLIEEAMKKHKGEKKLMKLLAKKELFLNNLTKKRVKHILTTLSKANQERMKRTKEYKSLMVSLKQSKQSCEEIKEENQN